MQAFFRIEARSTASLNFELEFVNDAGTVRRVVQGLIPINFVETSNRFQDDVPPGDCTTVLSESLTFSLDPGRNDVSASLISTNEGTTCDVEATLVVLAWGAEVASASCGGDGSPCAGVNQITTPYEPPPVEYEYDYEPYVYVPPPPAVEVVSLDTSGIAFPCPGSPTPVPTAELPTREGLDLVPQGYNDYFDENYDYPPYDDAALIPTVQVVCSRVKPGCSPAGGQCKEVADCCVPGHACNAGACAPPSCGTEEKPGGEGCACVIGGPTEQCNAPLECATGGPTAGTCQVCINPRMSMLKDAHLRNPC